MSLQNAPLSPGFFQMKEIFLAVREPEEMILGLLLDHDEAADREIDDRGGNVAHIHGVINQRADFAGRQLVRRLVLRGDGSKTRIAAAPPPQAEHEEESKYGNCEGPIAPEEAPN